MIWLPGTVAVILLREASVHLALKACQWLERDSMESREYQYIPMCRAAVTQRKGTSIMIWATHFIIRARRAKRTGIALPFIKGRRGRCRVFHQPIQVSSNNSNCKREHNNQKMRGHLTRSEWYLEVTPEATWMAIKRHPWVLQASLCTRFKGRQIRPLPWKWMEVGRVAPRFRPLSQWFQ